MFEEWFYKYNEIVSMSKADEMFKELGYKKVYDNPKSKSSYNLEYSNGIDMIFFDYKKKALTKFYISVDETRPENITVQELKAINEKIRELGWLDD